LAGEEVELQGIEMEEPIKSDYDSDGSDLAPGEVMEKTAIKYGRKRHGIARLTSEQAAKLDGLETGLVKELTPEQVEALPRVLHDLATNRGGGWSGFSSYRMQARKVLQESAKQHGLPWPSWLATIESRMNELQKKAGLNPIGAENLNQVMWALECAASGLGIGYRHWPVGVGVLLADTPAAEVGQAAAAPKERGEQAEQAAKKGSTKKPKVEPEPDSEEEDEEEEVETAATRLGVTKSLVRTIIQSGAEDMSAKDVRLALEASLGLEKGALKDVRKEISALIDGVVLTEPKPPPAPSASASAASAASAPSPSSSSSPSASSAATAAIASAAAPIAAARPAPRLLTLGSDVEMLKLEGEKLELAFGKDTSNGWCYRHALGKLAYLQDAMLEEHFGEAKAAPSIFELEVEQKEEGGEEEGEAEDDEQATKRPRVA
jgi:hypothetical protein